MAELVADLNESLIAGSANNIIAAAMAHLNCVAIHPFKDGNGRISRILQSFVLGQISSTVPPEFLSIEEYLGEHTSDYYAVLLQTHHSAFNPENADTREWLRFVLDAHVTQAAARKQQFAHAELVWSRLLALQNELPVLRSLKRSLPALFDVLCGIGLRTPMYIQTVADSGEGITEQTAIRDIRRLVDAGLLVPHGQTRGRYYTASPQLLALVK